MDNHRPVSQVLPSLSIWQGRRIPLQRDNRMSPDLPPPPLAQDLIAIRDAAAQLGLLLRRELQENSAARCAFDELVFSVSRLLSLAEDIGSIACGGERKSSSASYHKRRICRRRSTSYSSQKVLSKTLEDGHSWRKYGQKDIQTAKYPRSYFRCTHKTDQGCKAIRQVQVSEEDPSSFVLTYLGEHTCRDPLLVPDQIITAAGAQGSSFPVDIKIAEAVVPQASPVPSLNHEHCEKEMASHLRFPFGNDGEVTFPGSMEVEYFMEDMPEFEDFLGWNM